MALYLILILYTIACTEHLRVVETPSYVLYGLDLSCMMGSYTWLQITSPRYEMGVLSVGLSDCTFGVSLLLKS